MKRKSKKGTKYTAAVLAVVILMGMLQAVSRPAEAALGKNSKIAEKRAVWISMIDYKELLQDKSEKKFRSRFTAMCKRVKKNKLNTLILHVRPNADAFYDSEYFPWSVWANSGGKDPGYDPLEIMVEIGHKQGLKVEAWINPYRITNNTEDTKRVKKTKWYKKHKSYIMRYQTAGQKCLSLNPAKKKARSLIVKGVEEILDYYEVDGIHMDDYFYVPGMGKGLSEKEKKANVNKLVRQLYQLVKDHDEDCEFGISPAGNLENARAQGADVDRWLREEGYVDYLMPQIYWTDSYRQDGKEVAMYTNRVKEWRDLWENDKVKLYVGLGLCYAQEKPDKDPGWKKTNNLARQYKIAGKSGYQGFGLFSYRYLESKVVQKEIKNLRKKL